MSKIIDNFHADFIYMPTQSLGGQPASSHVLTGADVPDIRIGWPILSLHGDTLLATGTNFDNISGTPTIRASLFVADRTSTNVIPLVEAVPLTTVDVVLSTPGFYKFNFNYGPLDERVIYFVTFENITADSSARVIVNNATIYPGGFASYTTTTRTNWVSGAARNLYLEFASGIIQNKGFTSTNSGGSSYTISSDSTFIEASFTSPEKTLVLKMVGGQFAPGSPSAYDAYVEVLVNGVAFVSMPIPGVMVRGGTVFAFLRPIIIPPGSSVIVRNRMKNRTGGVYYCYAASRDLCENIDKFFKNYSLRYFNGSVYVDSPNQVLTAAYVFAADSLLQEPLNRRQFFNAR